MKKFNYIILSLSAVILFGCEDYLKEESKNKVTQEYLISTPTGLLQECIALYNVDRARVPDAESSLYASLMDRGCDIDVFRGGGGATFFRYDNLLPTNGDVGTFWRHQYRLIGKANEIIAGAKNMELDDDVKRALGEASVFRARAYFNLLIRFGRLYLTTEPVTADNIGQLKFAPANTDDVLKLIYDDLDVAIEYLNWKNQEDYLGRFTRGVAKHIKAKVAMWRSDWDEAIKQVDDIDASGTYSLLSEPQTVFEGADLMHKEAIFVYQFSRERGGGAGHRMSLIYNPNYSKIPGFRWDLSLGGYAWGRSYPNAYLLSLYNKDKDKRYKQWIKLPSQWVYQFADILPAGKKLGDPATVSNTLFMETMHTSTLKYYDKWTQLSASETASYKDVIVYRLAETYLLGAEAYMRKSGGSNEKALYYYNKTWVRAGNEKFTGVLTEQMIMDEHARELNFEGQRFEFLKRIGKFLSQTRTYGGETKADAISADYLQPRNNLKDYHIVWPIPQDEIDQMGGNTVFPQNPGYIQ